MKSDARVTALVPVISGYEIKQAVLSSDAKKIMNGQLILKLTVFGKRIELKQYQELVNYIRDCIEKKYGSAQPEL